MLRTSDPFVKAMLVVGVLFSMAAAAQDTLKYDPSEEADLERPVAREVAVSTQGPNYALQITFDRVPWGEDCRTRCANATFFLDTDGNPATGLKLSGNPPEAGADLSVTIQGIRHYDGPVPIPVLRAKVRRLSGTTIDEASVMFEYDHRKDTERIQSEEERVFVLVDATSPSLPSGKKLRLIYHPPGGDALELTTHGLRAGKGARVQVGEKKTSKKKK